MQWQLQEAKQKFSQLVRRAIEEGPQTVTRHGKEAVVVMSVDEFRRLNGVPDFKTFLLSGPSFDDLDLEWRRDLPRDIEL
jgi:prevent-host-death family protein